METGPLAAADGRRGHPFALFSLRLAATVLLLAGNAWVVLEYLEFWNTWYEVRPMVLGGSLGLPLVTHLMRECGVWPVVVTTAGVIAAIVYIWGFTQRVLPVILATVNAASLCLFVVGLMQLATEGAWKWDNGYHQRWGSHWQRLLMNL